MAARLTGYKIDIKSESQARDSGDIIDYDEYDEYDEEYMEEDYTPEEVNKEVDSDE